MFGLLIFTSRLTQTKTATKAEETPPVKG